MLAWLLGESGGPIVKSVLATQTRVLASELTLIEVDRGIRAALSRGRVEPVTADLARETLAFSREGWDILALEGELLEAARRTFPVEPVRTLDAIHLAAALFARSGLPELKVLSLDQRVRRNAEALGFVVVP